MVFVMCFTLTYHILLNQAFKPLFTNLPVMLDSAANQSILEGIQTSQPATKPWKRVMRSHIEWLNDVVGRLSEEELSATKDAEDYGQDQVLHSSSLIELQHEALRARQRTIWLSKDKLGVDEDEIKQTRKVGKSILISDRNAFMNDKGIVSYSGEPPV